MRIISGIAKNKVLKSRKGMSTRPTLERVKESLFEIIKPYLDGASFLDLYSGTGSIALEAISRGAKKAIMIEADKEALKIIIENVNYLGFEDKCRAYKNDVFRAIEILAKKNEFFELIFLDPPYNEKVCEKLIEKIYECKLLNSRGLIMAEHHISEKMPEKIKEYIKVDEREYNNKVISFYSFNAD